MNLSQLFGKSSSEPVHLLPSNKTPSFWNDHTAMGAVLGTFFTPIGTLIGAAIGGSYGKSKLEDELANGRPLRAPSPFNMKIFPGAVKGAALGAAIMAISFLPFIPGFLGLIGAVVMVVGGIQGGMMGSAQGMAEMKKEYTAVHGKDSLPQEPGREKSRSRKQQVDYGDSHPAHQAEQRGKSWTRDTQRTPDTTRQQIH